MGCCLSTPDAQRISAPPPPPAPPPPWPRPEGKETSRDEAASSPSNSIEEEEKEEEKVKQVVSEIPSLPPQTAHSLLQKQPPLVPLEPRLPTTTAESSPLKQQLGRRRRRPHSFSGDVSAVVCTRVAALSPNDRTRPDPSPSSRSLSGSLRIVHSKDDKADPQPPAGRRRIRRSPSITTTTTTTQQQSPTRMSMNMNMNMMMRKKLGSSKRVKEEGLLNKAKMMQQHGTRDMLHTPSVSLECFIFL